jgi:DNA polymerase
MGEVELFLDQLDTAEARALAAGRPAAPLSPTALLAALAPAPEVAVARPAVVEAAPAVAPGAAPAARDGATLRVLGEEVSGCTRCRLHEGRRNAVFGEGNAAAEVVIVGEAPGFEEDRTGRPFVGPAGKLLDLILLTAGFPRSAVYICNVLKCRPPDNRDPARDEVEQCSAHLKRQLEAIGPSVLLAVGKFAAQTLTGSEQSIGALRGRVHSYQGIPLVATYHPAFLLRSPQWMRSAWQDIQLLHEVLEARRGAAV